MVLGLDDPDALPRLAPAAFWCLIALMLAVWLLLRIRVARRQIERTGEATTHLAFIHALAAQSWIVWALGLLSLALAAAVIVLR